MSIYRLALASLANRRNTVLLTIVAIALGVTLLLGVERLRGEARRRPGCPLAPRVWARESKKPPPLKSPGI